MQSFLIVKTEAYFLNIQKPNSLTQLKKTI